MRRRYIVATLLLLACGWAVAGNGPVGPLGAAARRMEDVEVMLREGRTGPDVQETQQQILAELDRLVRQRQQEGRSPQRQSGLRELNEPTIPGAATGRPGQPAEESVLPGGRWERGRLTPTEAPEGDWAPGLPEAERRKLDDALRTGRLPSHYRNLLRAYNRRLAETETQETR